MLGIDWLRAQPEANLFLTLSTGVHVSMYVRTYVSLYILCVYVCTPMRGRFQLTTKVPTFVMYPSFCKWR